MLRAVVDPGVLISALISPHGAPAQLVQRWIDGHVQFVWSPLLLDELESVCLRPRFREWFSEREAREVIALIRDAGEERADRVTDVPPPPDQGDRYLVDLAASSGADCLVTGDAALLAHRDAGVRIVSPRQVLDVLAELA